MAYVPLKINGIQVAAPLPYTVEIADLDDGSGRPASGSMVRDRIRAGVRTIPLEWGLLTRSEVSEILSAVSGIYFPVQYDDPQLGVTTKIFYVGNRSAPKIIDGTFYKGLKFNVIER